MIFGRIETIRGPCKESTRTMGVDAKVRSILNGP